MAPLLTNNHAPAILVCLVTLLALSSCADSAEPEPTPRTPARYELTYVRYFLTTSDRLDTVVVPLPALRVQNTSNKLTTQQLDVQVKDLMKTSQFILDPTTVLPPAVDLSTVDVQVPAYWNGGESFTYFADAFSLSPAAQQKPLEPVAQQLLTLTIPPNARFEIHRQIDAYYLVCSFEGLLTNKATGQRYPVGGKWKGVLRYNNLATALTEQAL